MKRVKVFRCPECDSKFSYIKVKTQELVCRKCGNIWKDKQLKKGEKIGKSNSC